MAHLPTWLERHPHTVCILKTCRSKPLTEFRCPQGVWPLQRFLNNKNAQCGLNHTFIGLPHPLFPKSPFGRRSPNLGTSTRALCTLSSAPFALASISTVRCAQIFEEEKRCLFCLGTHKREVCLPVEVFSGKDVDLVHQQDFLR